MSKRLTTTPAQQGWRTTVGRRSQHMGPLRSSLKGRQRRWILPDTDEGLHMTHHQQGRHNDPLSGRTPHDFMQDDTLYIWGSLVPRLLSFLRRPSVTTFVTRHRRRVAHNPTIIAMTVHALLSTLGSLLAHRSRRPSKTIFF